MSRLLALVAAVALVAGAFVLRERLDERTSAPGSADGESTAGAQTLVCAADLRAACDMLEEEGITVRIEPAGQTVEALVADPTAAPDLWLVPQPWPEIARIESGSDVPADEDVSEVLAISPLVFAGFTERLETLESAACGGELTWRCLGEQAGTPWAALGLEDAGTAVVRPGHLDPTSSATGLLVLGSAVASFAGQTDLNRNDLNADAFAAWFSRLESAIPEFTPASGSQVVDMLTRGPASYDVVGTTAAEANSLLDAAPGGPAQISTRPGAATAEVVLVAFDADPRDALDRLGEPLRGAMQDAGWEVATASPVSEDGVPGAGFLVALQERWEEVAR